MTEAGLRERKKQKTREALIDTAYRLFVEKGFEETTIEEICAAVEVSPRTFFRYFSSKEAVVFLDQDLENQIIRETLSNRQFAEDDISLIIRALRATASVSLKNLPRALRLYQLVMKTPSLRGKTLEIMLEAEEIIVEGLAPRGSARDRRVRAQMLAAGFLAIFRAAFLAWVEDGMKQNISSVILLVEKHLREGFSQ